MSARKAIVLAAGLGTRLRPFTAAVPKPLLPVWGVPLLERIVEMLREHGVEEITVNCHYLADQVEAWCREHGCRASREAEILGTGGVLNPLKEWLAGEPFYLVNGDIVVEECPLAELDAALGGGDDVIASAIVTESGPRTIEVEPESGFVTNWKSDDAGCPGTFTYAGVALLKPAIFEFVKGEGFSTIVEAYNAAMFSGRFVKTVFAEKMLWSDAGTVDSYLELNRNGEENAYAKIPPMAAVGASAATQFLGARGSERAFFRDGGRLIVLYDDANRAENALYAGHARWLAAHGVSVPAVLDDRPDWKLTVFEWGGVEKKMSLVDYSAVVKDLVRFNALGGAADLPRLMPAFDAAMWKWERELFETHCLNGIFMMEMPAAVRAELEGVAERLEREPRALVHRDFQSTNILWKNGRLCFIDFQGMRLGPAVYDLASLVYDPYVELSDEHRAALVRLYAQESGRPEIAEVAALAAVERLVQCLGAYGRLVSVGQPQFGRFIVPALANLLAAADEANLDATGALAEELLAKATRSEHDHHHDDEFDCDCEE